MIDAYLHLTAGRTAAKPVNGCGHGKLDVSCPPKVNSVDHDMPEANSLEEAIQIACRSVTASHGIHGHQKRVPKFARKEMERRLLEQKSEVENAKDFHHLHGLVKMTSREVHGAGNLFCYDIALRIGDAWLKLSPEAVYLHAGTRDGAKALGITGNVVPLSSFPLPIQRLTPAQAEAFLCVYKKKIESLRFTEI